MLHKLTWSDEYSMGIAIIDKQHKDIIVALNNLFGCFDVHEGRRGILDDFLKKLDFYTTVHFDTEEKFMEDYNYPYIKEHKEKHNFFKNTYNEIKNNMFYREKDENYVYCIHLAMILGEWLDIHLKTIDKSLGEFLKSKSVR